MKKLFGLTLLVTALFAGVLFVDHQPSAVATNYNDIEQCNNETSYTKSSDYSDSKVIIDFKDYDDGDPQSIKVEAKTGYVLVSVQLDVKDDNHSGYHDYTSSFPGTFNPNPGKDIEGAKVKVKKVCTEVCNDPSATNYQAVVPGQTTANNNLCEYEVDVCENLPETQTEVPYGYHLEGEGKCVPNEQEVSPSPSPTSTPTPTPSNGTGGPGDGLGCAVNDCSQQQPQQPTQEVLGLSNTSSGANIYLNIAQLMAALTLAAAGFKLFRKHA